MSFLKNLFKSKPGGTKLGNLIRKVAKPAVKVIGAGVGAVVGGPAGAALGAKLGGTLGNFVGNGASLKPKDENVQSDPVVEQSASSDSDTLPSAAPSVSNNNSNNAIDMANEDKRESMLSQLLSTIKVDASWQGKGGNVNEVSFDSTPVQAKNNQMLIFAAIGLAAIVLLKGKR